MLELISRKACVRFIQMKKNRCIHTIKNECDAKTTFIILCARKSSRRGHKNIPLTPINEKETLIERQIKTISDNYQNSEIIVVSGFEHDKVVNYLKKLDYPNVRIAENKDYKSSDVFDGWRFALNIALKDDTYIIHGDRLFSDSYIKDRTRDTHTFVHGFDKNNYNLGVLHENGYFINMSYGLPNVWSEIFFISRSDFTTAKNIANEYKQRKIYTIEGFINTLSKNIKISVLNRNSEEVKILKEI
jgi:choline kinase